MKVAYNLDSWYMYVTIIFGYDVGSSILSISNAGPGQTIDYQMISWLQATFFPLDEPPVYSYKFWLRSFLYWMIVNNHHWDRNMLTNLYILIQIIHSIRPRGIKKLNPLTNSRSAYIYKRNLTTFHYHLIHLYWMSIYLLICTQ